MPSKLQYIVLAIQVSHFFIAKWLQVFILDMLSMGVLLDVGPTIAEHANFILHYHC